MILFAIGHLFSEMIQCWEGQCNLPCRSEWRLGLCGAAGGLRSVSDVCIGPDGSL